MVLIRFWGRWRDIEKTPRANSRATAHRLSTVQDADKTYVLDAGTVLEEGTHAELMERGGRYRLLVQSQALSTL